MERIQTKLNHLELGRQAIIERGVFQHPDLRFACLSGSVGASSAGPGSDIDITTVMFPDQAQTIDLQSMVELSRQLQVFCASHAAETGAVPIVISTIRLEEAQIALAEALHPGKQILPLHWLHYPSIEFARINEPPELFLGLLKGQAILGNSAPIVERFSVVNPKECTHLSGLDWLTDSLRVFLANKHDGGVTVKGQPDSFVRKLATHNLEYFCRWKLIRPLIEEKTGVKIENWNDALRFSNSVPQDVWETVTEARSARHQGERASTNLIIELHARTLSLWSLLELWK